MISHLLKYIYKCLVIRYRRIVLLLVVFEVFIDQSSIFVVVKSFSLFRCVVECLFYSVEDHAYV